MVEYSRAERASRDHGGNLDHAISRFGGAFSDWIDLSTGISPWFYPTDDIEQSAWQALPNAQEVAHLEAAARRFWRVPDQASVLAAPGASCLIARIPALHPPGGVCIDGPTYNEHAASFEAAEWELVCKNPTAVVIVHPNNPDGKLRRDTDLSGDLRIIDESFCDVAPERSLIAEAARPDTIVLKSFGKFWGLGGLRLGFAIGPEALIARLRDWLGPWPVSGPAIAIGTRALQDHDWAAMHRTRLAQASARLDRAILGKGATLVGGTSLFRLYEVEDAAAWQTRLGRVHIWSRIFPYNPHWLRLGLPPDAGWARLESDW